MICPYCGMQLDSVKRFCTECGSQVSSLGCTQKKRNLLGIVSFGISAVFAVVCISVLVPVVMVQLDLFRQLGGPLMLDWLCIGIVPLVTSILSTRAYKSRAKYAEGNNLTFAGLIVSWASFAACVCMGFVMLLMLF